VSRRSRNILISVVITCIVVCCCIALTVMASLLIYRRTSRPPAPAPVEVVETIRRTPTPVPPTATVASTVAPATDAPGAAPTRSSYATLAAAEEQPTPDSGSTTGHDTDASTRPSTADLVRSLVIPTRDMRDLALRLRQHGGDIPAVVNTSPPQYEEGDIETFWVGNVDTEEHSQIQAVLQVKLPHVYMWVEQGVNVDIDDLRRSAGRFQEQTFATNRSFFGSEWSPGVDNDLHLTILNASGLGDHVAGYFSSADEFSRLANPFSNEREMFYINLDNNPPGTRFYDGTLAHEFQHMIHWANDRNEDTWVNEGMSELATELNGFSRGGADQVFSESPDTQLTTWTDDPDLNTLHYGSAYLFMSYFLDRFGEDLTKAVVASPADGVAGFDEALTQAGYEIRFDDVFADWLIANYLDDPSLEEGQYGYERDNPLQVDLEERFSNYPVRQSSSVQQYGADYYELSGRGNVLVTFCGSTETKLVGTDAHSGRYAWWSSRADDSDARLTRVYDLSDLSTATLRFRQWFDLEEGYDYGYVVASTDGGRTWDVLQGSHSRDLDPVGNAFGVGYTGTSGGDSYPVWVEEEVDLSAYVGGSVQLRFEYVTDDAVNYPGWLIDDISVPELAYYADFETNNGGWQSEGWLLTDNKLPQGWLVQVIEKGLFTAEVHKLAVGDDGCGQLTLDNVGRSGRHTVLVVSAVAPLTTEEAKYVFDLDPE